MHEANYSIAWDDEFKIGNEKVDTQHKMLFDLLSVLVNQCIDGSSTELLQDTLDFLLNYIVQHFNDEESLQVRHNFPEYRKHKKMHDDFKLAVGDLVRRFIKKGSPDALCEDVNKLIIQWLVCHIQQEDKKIGQHIRLALTHKVSVPM